MTSLPSTSKSLNIGILGHVDSGKTTLTRRIAEMGSTSAFDPHSTGDIRRNTLDLGFSTFRIDGRRLALIDCPGHSGLIRAVLAASTVFDLAIVVIDAISGIQPQTAEHLLLVSLFCKERLIIVLNKIDLAREKNVQISEVKKKVEKGLKAMGFSNGNFEFVEMSLIDGHFEAEMLENLKSAVKSKIFEPKRDDKESFLMAIDHCFSIKGKGTVLTGTVIRGVLRLNDEIEFASLQERRRVKTLESWKLPVDQISSGERGAFLVSSFDSNRFSRCLIGAPRALKSTRTVLATVTPIPFFRCSLSTKCKMHISVAFETVMADCQFLREIEGEYEQIPNMEAPCQVLLTFEKPIFIPENFKIPLMASRLEQQKGCRFAFSGEFLRIFDEKSIFSLKRFTRKVRKGIVERIEKDGNSAICSGMFKSETNFDVFRDFSVILTESGIVGKIEGAFGKSGKFRVVFPGKIIDKLAEKEEISLFMKKYSGCEKDKLISYVPQ